MKLLPALLLAGCMSPTSPATVEPGKQLDNEDTARALEATVEAWERNIWALQPAERDALAAVPIYITVCPDCLPDSQDATELGACSIVDGLLYIRLFDHVPYHQMVTEVLPHEYAHKLQWYVFGVVDGGHIDPLVWSTVVGEAVDTLQRE